MSEPRIESGWCYRLDCPSPVGCDCFRGVAWLGETCAACAAKALGYPEGTPAEAMTAELLRRDGQ